VMARRRRVRTPQPITPHPFIGLSLMAAALFLYGYSAVVVPWYVFVGLMLVWAFLLLVSLAWWSVHPKRLPWVAGLAFVVWFVVLLGGGLAFEWGA
jgi:phosphatidylserine synthase